MARLRKVAVATVVIGIIIAAGLTVGLFFTPFGAPSISPDEFVSGAPRPEPTPTTASPKFDTGGSPSQSIERKIIYGAQITIEVPKVENTIDDIGRFAESLGGYVSGSSVSTFNEQKTGWITVRVPKDQFSFAVASIEKMGELKDKSTSSDDVTQQFIDLEARLTNLNAAEQSLQELLKRTGTVSEILEVERELARVRSEIDSLQGTINYLSKSVEFSQISVNLREPTSIQALAPDFGEALNSALTALYVVARGLVIVIFALAPVVAIVAPLVWLWRRRRRRLMAKKRPDTS